METVKGVECGEEKEEIVGSTRFDKKETAEQKHTYIMYINHSMNTRKSESKSESWLERRMSQTRTTEDDKPTPIWSDSERRKARPGFATFFI